MGHHLTTCTFCGVGCGLYLETGEGRVRGVYPSMSHPANLGKICVRGWNVHEVANSPDRLTRPLVRDGDSFRPASWDEALDLVTRRLRDIRDRHGPGALAFLNSPRCSNEESYLLQRLARSVFGTNNVDHGTGVYCNNSIRVLRDMIGVPATTCALDELGASEVIVIDGVDLSRQLPTVGGRVIRARLAGARLVVIDSRSHRIAESADLLLQPRPGTEAILYGAMAKVIVDRGLMDLPFIRAHCRDYDAFLDALAGHDLLIAAERCGVAPELIERAAIAYANARAAAILYSTGIEHRGSDSIRAIVNLALLAGQLGREGAGIFALTEHNNLQGVCDMGMLPDQLPGYQAVTDPAARARLGALWDAPLPAVPGAIARSILRDRDEGRVRALWLCRYDPVSSAFYADAADSLRACEFVVVQHLFLTETARLADVILPTTAFGEERVTFTSAERRIQIAECAVDPPGEVTPAWQQIAEVARRLGAPWSHASSSDVMDEIGQAIPFYSGASHDNLARDYGRQWPCTRDRPLGTRSLFRDGIAPGAFRFAPLPAAPPRVQAGDEYPFILVFGHTLYYWHRNVLIAHSETLKREYRTLLLDYPDGFAEINRDDAARLGIRDGQRVILRAATGSAETAARVTGEVRPGAVYVPYFVPAVHRRLCGSSDEGNLLVPIQVEPGGDTP